MKNCNQIGEEWVRAMRAGDFERAWEQTDCLEKARRVAERKGAFAWSPEYLLWDGKPFEGKRVVVHCNHGLGDTLQFLRFLPLLSQRARSVALLAQPALVGLLKGHDQFGRVCDGWRCQAVPAHDAAVEIMELAYAFRITKATLPRQVPYLFPRSPREAGILWTLGRGESGNLKGKAWTEPRRAKERCPLGEPCQSQFVPRTASLRVGLHWAASEWDPSRSVPLSALECLGVVRGARFFSLQQGPQAEEWMQQPYRIEPLAHLTRGIPEAALAIRELDLVITVDSMLAHLAGALGRPVWLLLKHEADWRWMMDRCDSPWYPTMRIFRQGKPGDWAGVAQEVANALGKLPSNTEGTSGFDTARCCF